MPRYIDAEKIPFYIRPVHMSQHSTSVEKIALASDIDKVPTADVVEVVRCKDCQYNKLGICSKSENWDCGKQYDPNYFCAHGERKDVSD